MTYSGKTVQEILDAVYEEAEKSIQEAWEDGYKQGVKEYAPRNAALEEVNRQLTEHAGSLEDQIKKERGRLHVWLPVGICAGAAAGTVITAIVTAWAR